MFELIQLLIPNRMDKGNSMQIMLHRAGMPSERSADYGGCTFKPVLGPATFRLIA